jgi:lysyl-tRNA synthetase class 2
LQINHQLNAPKNISSLDLRQADDSPDWQPTCALELLMARAELYKKIRFFFEKKGVLEVETPLLSHAIGTDPNLDFFITEFNWAAMRQQLYLQTSPEFAMKRLLAAGSGSIFQISKAFRNGESGRYHNPEFTLLEWYRSGFDLEQLMDEIAELMCLLLCEKGITRVERISYRDLVYDDTGLDCLNFDYQSYQQFAEKQGLPEAASVCGEEHAIWLDFLFSHIIQPKLRHKTIYLVYGYPACLSSLARINAENPLITERVELFVNRVELGNGYFELGDVSEQERRFIAEMKVRSEKKLTSATIDNKLLAALYAGLPDCAGMAIGLDRLLMVLTDSPRIDDVLSFCIDRA